MGVCPNLLEGPEKPAAAWSFWQQLLHQLSGQERGLKPHSGTLTAGSETFLVTKRTHSTGQNLPHARTPPTSHSQVKSAILGQHTLNVGALCISENYVMIQRKDLRKYYVREH